MKKQIIIAVLLFLAALNDLYAQKEYYNWYFGAMAGISFNTPDKSPVSLPGGRMDTPEGCSAVSDSSGKLLFYTDGRSVWNKKHNLMPNGTGLSASFTSTQAAFIAKQPWSDSKYYIFTNNGDITADESKLNFSYSIVNMNLNGGDGDIETKNILLFSPCVEKIAAVRHRNGRDIWILGHESRSDRFRLFLLTPDGLKEYPPQSIGAYHGYKFGDNVGYMKFSNDASILALNIYESKILNIFHFDNETGILSSPIEVSSVFDYDLYGLEFSPDNSKLYLSACDFYEGAILYQMDIDVYENQAITDSKKVIWHDSSQYFGALQAGPDGKIYIASYQSGFLSVVEKPNKSGAGCGFSKNSLMLIGSSMFGLPNCLSFHYGQKIIIKGGDACKGETIYLSGGFADGSVGDSYEWSGPGFSSTDSEPEIPNADGNMTGWYYLTAALNGFEYTDSVYIKVHIVKAEIIPEGPLENCEGKSIILRGGPGGKDYSYKWSTGDASQIITATSSGRYTLTVTDSYGCSDSMAVECRINAPPKAGIIGDSAFCEGEPIVIMSDKEHMYYDWSTGETAREIEVRKPGTYYLLVTDSSGCRDTVFINIKMHPKPQVKISGETFFCKGDSVILSAEGDFASYRWSTGESTKDIIIKNAGEYILTVTNADGCKASDTLNVKTASPDDIAADLKELSFGDVFIEKKAEKIVNISNKGESDYILNVYLKNGNGPLKLLSANGLINAPAGEILPLSLEFAPGDIIDYRDTLIIEAMIGCPKIIVIPVSGAGLVRLAVKLPNISAWINEEICAELSARFVVDKDFTYNGFSFSADISLKPDIMEIHGSSAVIGGQRIIAMTGSGVSLSNRESDLGEFCGLTTFGQSDYSLLQIDTIYCSNRHIIFDTTYGFLSLKGLCHPDYVRMQLFNESSIRISPNPVSGSAEISVSPAAYGACKISVYNITGIETAVFEWNNNDGNEKLINYKTDNLAAGVYYVRLFIDKVPAAGKIMFIK